MDYQIDDWNDACWHQLELEEQHQREQRMLSDDTGYTEFLQTYEAK
jgi:hypothetical protein